MEKNLESLPGKGPALRLRRRGMDCLILGIEESRTAHYVNTVKNLFGVMVRDRLHQNAVHSEACDYCPALEVVEAALEPAIDPLKL